MALLRFFAVGVVTDGGVGAVAESGTVAASRILSMYGRAGPATVRAVFAITFEISRAVPAGCCAPYQYKPYVNNPTNKSTGNTRRRDGSGMPMGLAIGTTRAASVDAVTDFFFSTARGTVG